MWFDFFVYICSMEKEILELRQRGFTYKQIVKEIGCSISTVSYYCGKGQKDKAAVRRMKNRAERISSQRSTRVFLKEFLRRYKQFKGCVVCGIKDWRVLDCDHINPLNKSFKIGDVWKWSHSIKLLKEELRKCNIMCANCHRIKTIESKDYHREQKN